MAATTPALPRSSPGWVRAGWVATLMALVASGCSGHPKGSDSGPSMSVEVTSGSATVTGGGSTRTVTGQTGLGLGYKVTLGPGGSAIVRLASGRTFELMGGGVLITGKDRLQLAGGSALGTLTAPGELDTGGLTVTSRSGTFRVEAGASPRVGVYAGSATMGVPGGTLAIPAFRQGMAAAGRLPPAPRPLQLTGGGDAWDHRFLQDAIDLDARLANFGGGLDAQLGGASGVAFFQLVIPDTTQVGYVAPYSDLPRSDVLIGFVLASSAAAASHADLQATFSRVMALWQAGESWGILAREYNVSADAVVTGLLAAIRRVGISVATPNPSIARAPATGPVARATPVPTPAPAPTIVASAPPSGSLAPEPSPTPLLNQLLDPVTQLLGQILSLLAPRPVTQTVTPGPGG